MTIKITHNQNPVSRWNNQD